MAKEEIVYSVEVDSSKAGKSLSDLKKEFKETQAELSKTTQGTKEYLAQLQKLGTIKDEMQDLKKTIETFNPDNKIKAFGNVVGGLAGGFSAAQGAMALFGGENKELEKTLVRVQAAMAFQQGIQGLTGLKDAFSDLWLIVKANPLGALLSALALVATAVTAFYYSMDKSSEATKSLNQQLEAQTAIVEILSRSNKREIDLLTSQGASTQILIEKKKELINAQILELELSIKSHQSKINDIRDNNSIVESYYELIRVIALKTGDTAKAEMYEVLIQANKLERAKEDLDAIKKEREDLADLKNAVLVLNNEKATANNKETQNYLDNLKKKEDAEKEHNAKIEALWRESLYNKQQDEINSAYETSAQKQAILDAELAAQNEAFAGAEEFKTTVKVNALNEYTEKEKASFNQTLQTAQATTQSLSDLSNLYFDLESKNATKGSVRELALAKKRFNINKAIAISSNIISTIVGVTNALSAVSVIPDPFGTILKVANAAAVGISGTVATAKIASQKFNEGGGSAGGGGGSISLPTPNVAPPSQGSTQLNSDGTVKASDKNKAPTIKAIVVETDITKTQKRIGSIETNAKL
jgi:hypothetical protein